MHTSVSGSPPTGCGGFSSSSSSTPKRAACSTAAPARYGFAAASAVRCSSLVVSPRAGGTRTVTLRSSWPQFAQ